MPCSIRPPALSPRKSLRRSRIRAASICSQLMPGRAVEPDGDFASLMSERYRPRGSDPESSPLPPEAGSSGSTSLPTRGATPADSSGPTKPGLFARPDGHYSPDWTRASAMAAKWEQERIAAGHPPLHRASAATPGRNRRARGGRTDRGSNPNPEWAPDSRAPPGRRGRCPRPGPGSDGSSRRRGRT